MGYWKLFVCWGTLTISQNVIFFINDTVTVYKLPQDEIEKTRIKLNGANKNVKQH